MYVRVCGVFTHFIIIFSFKPSKNDFRKIAYALNTFIFVGQNFLSICHAAIEHWPTDLCQIEWLHSTKSLDNKVFELQCKEMAVRPVWLKKPRKDDTKNRQRRTNGAVQRYVNMNHTRCRCHTLPLCSWVGHNFPEKFGYKDKLSV